MLVYDCTRRSTFESVTNWLKKIDDNAEQGTLKVLVANKIDAPDINVEHEEGRALAKTHGLEFFAASAKTGEGVDDLFNNTSSSVISQSMLAQERAEKEKTTLSLKTTTDKEAASAAKKRTSQKCC